jgi:hypothetical protein
MIFFFLGCRGVVVGDFFLSLAKNGPKFEKMSNMSSFFLIFCHFFGEKIMQMIIFLNYITLHFPFHAKHII